MPGFGKVYQNSFWQITQNKPDYETLPSPFRKAGYRTAIAGKRHLPKENHYPELEKFPYEVLCDPPTTNIAEVAAEFLKGKYDCPFLLYIGL